MLLDTPYAKFSFKERMKRKAMDKIILRLNLAENNRRNISFQLERSAIIFRVQLQELIYLGTVLGQLRRINLI